MCDEAAPNINAVSRSSDTPRQQTWRNVPGNLRPQNYLTQSVLGDWHSTAFLSHRIHRQALACQMARIAAVLRIFPIILMLEPCATPKSDRRCQSHVFYFDPCSSLISHELAVSPLQSSHTCSGACMNADSYIFLYRCGERSHKSILDFRKTLLTIHPACAEHITLLPT